MEPLDRRIWYPDESCLPLFWNTAGTFIQQAMGRFRIPRSYTGVITNVICVATSMVAKETARVILTQDQGQNPKPIPIHGSLLEIDERGGDGVNYPGFAVVANSGPKPVRILLNPGTYYPFMIGNAGAVPIAFGFSGWMIPLHV